MVILFWSFVRSEIRRKRNQPARRRAEIILAVISVIEVLCGGFKKFITFVCGNSYF